ncbi:MAG TPA: hypothetical protein RWO09_09735, partial [Ruminococcus sp.]
KFPFCGGCREAEPPDINSDYLKLISVRILKKYLIFFKKCSILYFIGDEIKKSGIRAVLINFHGSASKESF